MKSEKPQQPVEDTSITMRPEAPPAVFKDDGPKPDAHNRMTVENWALVKKTAAWQFKAAKAGKQWPEGKELTEKDYDEAIAWLNSKDCVCR